MPTKKWIKEHPEYWKAWLAKHPEYKGRKYETWKRWVEKHRDRRRAIARASYHRTKQKEHS